MAMALAVWRRRHRGLVGRVFDGKRLEIVFTGRRRGRLCGRFWSRKSRKRLCSERHLGRVLRLLGRSVLILAINRGGIALSGIALSRIALSDVSSARGARQRNAVLIRLPYRFIVKIL